MSGGQSSRFVTGGGAVFEYWEEAVVEVVEDLACLVKARHDAAEVQRRHLYKQRRILEMVLVYRLGWGSVRLSVFAQDHAVGELG